MKYKFLKSINMRQFKKDFIGGFTHGQLAEKYNISIIETTHAVCIVMDEVVRKNMSEVVLEYPETKLPASIKEVEADLVSLHEAGFISDFDMEFKYGIKPTATTEKTDYLIQRSSFQERLEIIR